MLIYYYILERCFICSVIVIFKALLKEIFILHPVYSWVCSAGGVHVSGKFSWHLFVVCTLIRFSVTICQEMSTHGKFTLCCYNNKTSHLSLFRCFVGCFSPILVKMKNTAVKVFECYENHSNDNVNNIYIKICFIVCFSFFVVMFCIYLSVGFACQFTCSVVHSNKLTYFPPRIFA